MPSPQEAQSSDGHRVRKTATILVVDDDELILSTLRGLFLLETDYEVVMHSDPAAALSEAEGRPVEIVISDFLMPRMNACAAIAWISADPSLHLTTAGLPFPYLLRKGNEKPDELPLSGMPLGLFHEALPNSYDSRSSHMEPGDLLLLATDGLGEIRGSDDRFFQDGDLAAALPEIKGSSGENMIQHIMKRAGAFAARDSYDDDVTIVAITRE